MGKKEETEKSAGKRYQVNKYKGRAKDIPSASPFSRLYVGIYLQKEQQMGRKIPYSVNKHGDIYLNQEYLLSPKQWAYGIAHCFLHLAFGHFDAEKVQANVWLWNQACDIYVEKFLKDIKFGEVEIAVCHMEFLNKNLEEIEIYHALQENENKIEQGFQMDMRNLESVSLQEKKDDYDFSRSFSYALANAVSDVVSIAGGHEKEGGIIQEKQNVQHNGLTRSFQR